MTAIPINIALQIPPYKKLSLKASSVLIFIVGKDEVTTACRISPIILITKIAIRTVHSIFGRCTRSSFTPASTGSPISTTAIDSASSSPNPWAMKSCFWSSICASTSSATMVRARFVRICSVKDFKYSCLSKAYTSQNISHCSGVFFPFFFFCPELLLSFSCYGIILSCLSTRFLLVRLYKLLFLQSMKERI